MHTQILNGIFLILSVILSFVNAQQPPYQVSLFIRLHPKEPPVHLCNGAIIQSKLILTTAACVHYLLIPDRPVIPVHPSMLTVIAGSSNALTDALSVEVKEIIFHEKFNETTMENDLALLRLKTRLPLEKRDDIQWIILDEYKKSAEPCLANFYVRNSLDKIPDYTQTEELEILDNEVCNEHNTTLSKARKEDICSNYVLPVNFKCNDFPSFIPFNGDRGTGLVCNSHLIGLLSTILPMENTNDNNNCSEKSVRAYYTYIGSYMHWAYEFIVEEELNASAEMASAPYDQETEAVIQTEMTKTLAIETTQTTTTIISISTPEVQPLHSSAKKNWFNTTLMLLILLQNVICYF